MTAASCRARPVAAALAGLVAATALAACDSGEATRADEGTGGSIAFVRARTGSEAKYDLATAQPSGYGLRVLTGAARQGTVVPGLFTRVTWSPDGRRLAFAGVRHPAPDPRRSDVWVMRADGSGARRVTKLRHAGSPLWSPDGKRLVFTRWRTGQHGQLRASLWSVRVDGSGLRRLTRTVKGRADQAGSFSPSGRRLFFTRGTCASGGCLRVRTAIYVANADGTSQKRVLRHASDPALSPDGSRIAFASDRDRNGKLNYGDREFFANELYVMKRDRSGKRRLTRSHELNEAVPTWSPDGARIAFQRGEQIDNAEGMSLLQVNPDGTCPRKILLDPRLGTWYAGPAWRPGPAPGPLTCG
jgi:Tol biopolymer transport system component